MSALVKARDTIHWYLSELTSRIVAETGIPSDRYHLGKVILQSLKDAPDFILQIDAKSCKSDTSGTVLERSVRCALSLKKMGLKSGDVMVILGPNHLDMAVMWYAALYLGITVAALDMFLGVFLSDLGHHWLGPFNDRHVSRVCHIVIHQTSKSLSLFLNELKEMFLVEQPNIIVCQNEHIPKVTEAIDQINLQSHIVTFDDGSEAKTFSNLIKESVKEDVYSFKPENINPEETIAFLTSTSGSTGLPKVVSVTHKNFLVSIPYFWSHFVIFPYPTKATFVISPIQWMSATIQYIFSPILRFTRIQTPEMITHDVFIDVVNKYKPTFIMSSPTLIISMMKPGIKEKIDFSCFKDIMLGGSAVQQQLIDELKKLIPNVKVYRCYGLSEATGFSFDYQDHIKNSVGKPWGHFNFRIVNPETLQDITEPFVNGELLLKGPGVFKGYYNNPELTKEVLLDDGWLRTGDIFYRDEHFYFYFVDRLKMMLKYRNNQISPIEIEKVIYTHPGVLDVAVTGIPDPECGDLPVACVVPRPGHTLTAQEIKDLVKDTLSDSKQLRGGVIFMKSLPLTVTTKVDRTNLKEIVKNVNRE